MTTFPALSTVLSGGAVLILSFHSMLLFRFFCITLNFDEVMRQNLKPEGVQVTQQVVPRQPMSE